MNVRILPANLKGEVFAPSSKSVAHRALICAALANESSTVFPVDRSKDMEATIGALKTLGASIVRNDNGVTITGIGKAPKQAKVDCIESGSTLRFLIPIAAAKGISCQFIGSGRLPERPLAPYVDAFERKGAHLVGKFVPSHLSGQLQPGAFILPGNISSQFITGLLFALPLLSKDSTITLSTPLESAPYVDLTIHVLREFGVHICWEKDKFTIPGNQKYLARKFQVEGDFSNAAFFLTAAALGNSVKVFGLSQNSLQGDRKILNILSALGAMPVQEKEFITVRQSVSRPTEIDGRDVPDLLPILCVAAAAVPGRTVIRGTKRLKIKESDRAAAMVDCLSRLGGQIREETDTLIVERRTSFAWCYCLFIWRSPYRHVHGNRRLSCRFSNCH